MRRYTARGRSDAQNRFGLKGIQALEGESADDRLFELPEILGGPDLFDAQVGHASRRKSTVCE